MSQRPGPVVFWVQKWEESEEGWGTRPDGYTLHRKVTDIAAFLADMRHHEAAQGYGLGNAPPEYSRPSGDPYETAIDDDALIEKVKSSHHGIWGAGNRYPEPITPGTDRTGWCDMKEDNKRG